MDSMDEQSEPGPRAPGWEWEQNGRKAAYVWWDGQKFVVRAIWDGSSWRYEPVGEPVPLAPPRARRMITLLIVVGCATLVWGGWALSRADERACPSSNFTYTDVSGLWLPWLVMLVLAGCGVWVRRRLAPDVPKIKRAARLGVIATVLTFPGWVAVMGAANCGM